MKAIKLAILCLCFSQQLVAQDALPRAFEIISDTIPTIVIPDSCWQYVKDNSLKWTIDSVQQMPVSGKFQDAANKLQGRDYPMHNFWIRYRLKNKMDRTAKIFLRFLGSNECHIYLVQRDGSYQHYVNGANIPWSKRDGIKTVNRTGNHYLPISIDSGQEIIIYTKTLSLGGYKKANLSINLYSQEQVSAMLLMESEFSYFDILANSFFWGAILLAFFFNMIFYFLVKDKMYLYFSLYVFVLGLNRFTDGFYHLFFRESPQVFAYIFPFIIVFIYLFFTFFLQCLLKIPTSYPRWSRFLSCLALLGLMYFFVLTDVIIPVFPSIWNPFLIPLHGAIAILVWVSLLATLSFYLGNPDRSIQKLVRFLFPAFSTWVILWSLLNVLGQLFRLFDVPLSAFAIKLGTNWPKIEMVCLLWMIISFSWFLLSKFSDLKRQIVQKELEKEMERSQLMAQQNVQLEEQVSQRTEELVVKNRELEIEAALERVRASTLSMQVSNEVLNVATTLYDELQKLDFTFGIIGINLIDAPTGDMESWVAGFGQDNYPQSYNIPYFDHPFQKGAVEAWRNGSAYWTYQLAGTEKKEYDDFMFSQSGYKAIPDAVKERMMATEQVIFSLAFMRHGALLWGPTALTEEKGQVFQRFAKVFEQAYSRFLDLKKAEEQAREAQIEAALERVRSRSMAMQSSQELSELVEVVYQQFNSLKIANWGARIMLMHPEEPSMEIWLSENDQKVYPHSFFIRGEDTLFVREQWEGWHSNKEQFSLHLFGDKKQEYDDIIFERHDYRLLPEVVKAAIRQIKEAYFNFSRMQYGFLVAISVEGRISSEGMMVLGRFAKVFEQTYTRFLDLQRAEAQAREAQIEAALERVRSHAMTMQQTDELSNVINTLFQQLTGLGLKIVSSWVTLMHTEQSELEIWMTHAKGNAVPTFVNTSEYETFEREMQAWRDGQHIALEIPSHIARGIVERIFKIDINPPADKPSWYLLQHWHSYGYIGLSTWNPATEEEHNIINRFAKVFEQTYTRFLDLQKAEARAIEAARTASLDRVRGEIASMRSTEDLQRITPLVWQELTSLGVPFFRCGVFIMDETSQLVHTYLSTPDGKSLSVLHLPFDGAETTRKTVQHWYKQKVYLDNWDKQQFTNWMQSLIEEGYIKESKAYQGAEQAPEALALHFVPFNQGMLYVGHSERLSDEQIDLVHRLAEAFAVAYARYEDFVKLEDAKYRVEITLTELQSTQAQLIQSEKLASLGELTAGIAHEIQNPLNFVNNFAEVSAEMVDEMHEELEKGETTEAVAIAADLKTNLEKINHHGQRASSIVKGMLEHSRASTGVKEPIDLNVLADEYLRLAYHGLRAKNSNFNATLETHFDPELPLVSVVPQDMGRVLLNLINNAFYAVHQRTVETLHATSLHAEYQPTVTISTQKTADQIIIKVKDNGPGIPESIREKIFQPFFTTKPTGQGTGLGLSLAYDIVTKGHGGLLEIDNSTEEGTNMIIRLPLS